MIIIFARNAFDHLFIRETLEDIWRRLMARMLSSAVTLVTQNTIPSTNLKLTSRPIIPTSNFRRRALFIRSHHRLAVRYVRRHLIRSRVFRNIWKLIEVCSIYLKLFLWFKLLYFKRSYQVSMWNLSVEIRVCCRFDKTYYKKPSRSQRARKSYLATKTLHHMLS